MSISPARSAAFDILLRVERENSYASELLHSSRYSTMSLTDHGLTTELVMGVQRWRSLLDAHGAPTAQAQYVGAFVVERAWGRAAAIARRSSRYAVNALSPIVRPSGRVHLISSARC